ncbi:cation:dicarboxylase symporter family transporter [Altererythrobacter aerius]|uniref:Cation:dicarboxylase symporter family transporter n=1 Tax=Tsuneonella aeria TaxID=1837929 RepID=A0A6I4TCM6_9SPHN|nr:cation:dicarboxylase symporter family transporter [Tsuneonella aeria]MXO74962.1 cation:dicarboxylase symporter family transporter [Tsuneonella aeria]
MDNTVETRAERQLVTVRIPAGWTLLGLVAGLVCGLLVARSGASEGVLAIAAPVGTLWLRALQVTIVPLVAALLVLGIAQISQAAMAGAVARRMLGWVFAVLLFSGVTSVTFIPFLLDMFPPPSAAAGVLSAGGAAQDVPGLAAFVESLIAPNIIAAAAETAMLPLTLFFAAFALALVRLPAAQRDLLLAVFRALANTMLLIIGAVLWVAPIGVFALAVGVGAASGGAAFATLAHYILIVVAAGTVVLIAGYMLAWLVGGIAPHRFFRALVPAQAVALSTQSSLASLPAMLDAARRLKLREETAEFVLPLAVAIFRATSPAMNLAVAIYVAHLAGVELTPAALAAGVAVAVIIAIGSVSLPGTISFVVSVGPIALAMGVPIGPLALLVAVEMMPDLMRTIGNVTLDTALAAAVDRKVEAESGAALQP